MSRVRVRRRRRARSLRVLAQLGGLLLGLSLTGCCLLGGTDPVRPLLPPGSPTWQEDDHVKGILMALPKPDGEGPNATLRITVGQLRDVLVNRLGWRSYALALEQAGDWRKQ